MFCCTLLYVLSSIAIILMGKRELIALLNLSSWCLVMVERLFLTVPRGNPDQTDRIGSVGYVSILIESILSTEWQCLKIKLACTKQLRF